jgi:hypothetical protein
MRAIMRMALAVDVLVLLPAACGQADAGFMVSKLDHSDEHITVISFDARSFTPGATNPMLGSVTLRLSNPGALSQPVTVNLSSGIGSQPGASHSPIVSFALPAIQCTFADYTPTAPSPVTLLDITTYGVEAQASIGSLEWGGHFPRLPPVPTPLGAGDKVRP